MKIPSPFAVGAVLSLVVLSGCGQSEPIVGTWNVSKTEQRAGAVGDWTTSEACHQDNVEEFAEDGQWTLYEGNAQCGQGGTGISKGTWELAAGRTKVIHTYEDAPGEYERTVEELTDSTMVLSHSAGDLEHYQFRTSFTKAK